MEELFFCFWENRILQIGQISILFILCLVSNIGFQNLSLCKWKYSVQSWHFKIQKCKTDEQKGLPFPNFFVNLINFMYNRLAVSSATHIVLYIPIVWRCLRSRKCPASIAAFILKLRSSNATDLGLLINNLVCLYAFKSRHPLFGKFCVSCVFRLGKNHWGCAIHQPKLPHPSWTLRCNVVCSDFKKYLWLILVFSYGIRTAKRLMF